MALSMEANWREGVYSANFYKSHVSTALWAEVEFTDIGGVVFMAGNIFLYVDGGWPVEFSFDPRAAQNKTVHGSLGTGETLELSNKDATNIFIRIPSGGTASNIKIHAWR